MAVFAHFLKRGRIGRMLPLMMAKGYKLGLGIEENSAAIVQGDLVEVVGGKGALLIDLNDVLTDPNDAVIAKTVVALGHSLGLKVIAEGVETREELACLQEIGVHLVQGYLFGKPQFEQCVADISHIWPQA